MAHIIVFGNEKGGSGKSTTAMHVATALSRMGHRVAALDIDVRQRTFGRYVENRRAYAARQGLDLPMPVYHPLPELPAGGGADGENPLDRRLALAAETAGRDAAFLVIDCPGSHSRLSQIAHAMADTLVTPLNDSFVDFDLLARIDPVTHRVAGPSIYSEMVWQARQLRAQSGLKPIDWVVLRNRVGSQDMRIKRRMTDALSSLSKRIGFRVAPGFGDRVIFRELFPNGLTLLDLRDVGITSLTMSNVAARQELRDLVRALSLPGVAVEF